MVAIPSLTTGCGLFSKLRTCGKRTTTFDLGGTWTGRSTGVVSGQAVSLTLCPWNQRYDDGRAWNSYDTQDGLYDVAWSEVHENQLVTASGDGTIKLWDVMINVSLGLKSVLCLAFMIEGVVSNLGSSHSCMARTHPRSVLCGLVEYKQRPVHFCIMGWHSQIGTPWLIPFP